MKHIKYPKTGQYRNVVSNILSLTQFVGLDENGEAIYDYTIKKPTIKFKGTVKLHGTNAGICYNDKTGLYVQSRNNSISLDHVDSHMGFTFLVKNKESLFLKLIKDISERYNINTNKYTITIYGEWAGEGIQKNVAISELKKAYYIFGCKISKPNDSDFTSYWVDISDFRFPGADDVWNINEFKTYELEVDFNNPSMVKNTFVELINEVENECPVAKHFGVSGLGEGIVFTTNYKNNRLAFKIKGEKHAGKSRIKKTKPIDEGRLKLANEIADKVTPIWRLNQMFNEVTNNGKDVNRKHIGPYIKLVIKDVVDEDGDIIMDSGLELKEVTGIISNISKDYFFEQEKMLGY